MFDGAGATSIGVFLGTMLVWLILGCSSMGLVLLGFSVSDLGWIVIVELSFRLLPLNGPTVNRVV